MENKSLIANLIAKCKQQIDAKCKTSKCKRCQYWRICVKVARLNIKFKEKGYLK